MYRKTLSVFVLALIFFVQVSNAKDHAYRPVSLLGSSFLHKAMEAYEKLNLAKAFHGKPGKICSCQVLDLKSANYDHKHVAVFAEKSGDEDFTAGYHTAKVAIEKEKKHLKDFFYDQLRVVGSISEATDCRTLYVKLKYADQSLVMYDILDADLRIRK